MVVTAMKDWSSATIGGDGVIRNQVMRFNGCVCLLDAFSVPGYDFHNSLMTRIVKYYMAKFPRLKFAKVKSDGCTSQYKGRKNFNQIARFHVDSVDGVKIIHDFPAPHHYGGPHDNAGKWPR